MLSPTQIIKIIKSITAKEIYRLYPQIKKKLWEVTFGVLAISLVPLEEMVMRIKSKIT